MGYLKMSLVLCKKNGSGFWREGKGFSVEGGVAVVSGEGRRAGQGFMGGGGGSNTACQGNGVSGG